MASATIWSREDVAYCKCTALHYMHSHCPCSNCMGRAVSRSTEYSHWENACVVAARNAQHQLQCQLEVIRREKKTASLLSDDEEDIAVNSAPSSDTYDDSDVLRESEYMMDENPIQNNTGSGEEMNVENTILHVVLHAMKMQQDFSGSQDQFMCILNYGQDLYCKGDRDLQSRWPSLWQSCVALLQAQGYIKPKKLYICLDEEHPSCYDVMDSPINTCK